MNVGTIINAHGDEECVADTIDSILKYVGDKVLLIVDGAKWHWGKDLKVPVHKMEGFYHNCSRAPYRNVALGLKQAWEMWKGQVDWFCYVEYDCLFTSSEFKSYLTLADNLEMWCLGNDYRGSQIKLPLIERILKSELSLTSYLLGCCVFYKHVFLEKLSELDFFNKFLHLTNEFSGGFFPNYEQQGGYDLSEHLYPTLVHHLGGKIGQLAVWNEKSAEWSGEFKKFPLRFRPDLGELPDESIDLYKEATICHPLKSFDSPIRKYFREKRKI